MNRLLKDSRGIALAIVMEIVTILLMITGASLLFSKLDLRITDIKKQDTKTVYITDAGISHAQQILTVINGSTDFKTVSNAADTTALLTNFAFAGGSYTIIGEPVVGSNPKRVKLTSTGCLPAATGAGACPPGSFMTVIEAQADQFNMPPLPGTITLIGNNANFTGGNSNAKTLSGNDSCGSDPSLPIVAATDGVSKTSVQTAINNSKPNTYYTLYAGGTKADDIVASGAVDLIKTNYGFDYTNGNDLTVLVSKIEKHADSVVAGGATGVDLGSPGDEKVVVVNGNFTLSATNGAGILVVKGDLTFNGNVSYTGVILVVGTGVMRRNGGGSGTISGGIIVAKVAGGVIGSTPTLDTSGGGNSDILYCSSAIKNATSRLVEMLAWMQKF